MDRKKAIALSFSVPVAWGFSYPLMKIGMDSMNATSIAALHHRLCGLPAALPQARGAHQP